MANDGDHIPLELKQLPQWVLWRYEARANSNGGSRQTKVPCQRNGLLAKSTDPKTWCSYQLASEALANNPEKFAGPGFVFDANDPYTGIDLDNALIEGGSLKPWASNIVSRFKAAYLERSPSGRGVKIWAKGKLPGAGKQFRISKDERIEMYDRGRFFAVTGQLYGNPVEAIGDHQAEIDWLYGRLVRTRARGAGARGHSQPEIYTEGTRHEALLSEAGRQARRVGADAAKTFEAVWQFNSARCSPPKDEQEVQSIVDWACSQERANKSPCPSAANWYDHLILNQNGNPKPILANAIIALRYAPEWCGVLAFNEFSIGTVALKAPPWNGAVSIAEWTDHEDRLTADWLQHAGIIVSVEIAGQAIQVVARDRRFHPVREYLDSLKWDGTKRIDAWLSDYLGAERNDYTAAVGARWLISAVARIYNPGAKADHCLILEGTQGLLKSTALKTIAVEWFTDEIAELGSKDAAMQTRGVWIIEIAELDSMTRADVSKIKAFMSRACDRFRPPYGRRLIESPRQCVFAGTVNQSAYLRDDTGGRRFWPVACTRILIDDLARDRDQVWAEAVVRYRSGSPWWLNSRELNRDAEQEQAARYVGDPWSELIAGWLKDPTQRFDEGVPLSPFTSSAESVSISDVLLHCIGKRQELWTQSDQNRVAACLQSFGWERYRKRIGNDLDWHYRRKES